MKKSTVLWPCVLVAKESTALWSSVVGSTLKPTPGRSRCVAEWLHVGGERGIEMPQRDADDDRKDHLHVQDFIEGYSLSPASTCIGVRATVSDVPASAASRVVSP